MIVLYVKIWNVDGLFIDNTRIHKHKIHAETTSLVPFGERPGSGKLNKDAFDQLMKAMDDLDSTNNMPEGLDTSVWEHFCMTRRAKVENEQKVYNILSFYFISFHLVC